MIVRFAEPLMWLRFHLRINTKRMGNAPADSRKVYKYNWKWLTKRPVHSIVYPSKFGRAHCLKGIRNL